MIVYHEVSQLSVKSILQHGLKRTDHGEKSDDDSIIKTNHFLDKYRPKETKQAQVSRSNNIYAYIVSDDQKIIRIADGEAVGVDIFVKESRQAVLCLTVDSKRCYVSDLDAYDKVKKWIAENNAINNPQALAESYWSKLTPLATFELGSIRRPEVMITYDILPIDIKTIN